MRAGSLSPVRTPMQAPLGSVLVYVGDARVGKRPRGTPGGYYGHVEMVALGFTGQRLYVADSPRVLPGGTVRDNFTGRAWLPPGNHQIWKAPPVEEQVATVLQERNRMAMAHFTRSKGEFTSLSLPSSSERNRGIGLTSTRYTRRRRGYCCRGR